MKELLIYFILGLVCCFAKGQTSTSGCYLSGALIDPVSTAGCGNGSAYCNLASLYVPAFTPTACGTSVVSGGVSHAKGTAFLLPAGCTATVEAEFRKRNYLGVGSTSIGCSNSGMDGSPDGLAITQSGGVVGSQGSTITVNVGTCGAYPALGTYTTAVSTLSPGCSNADGYVKMVVTGGTVSIAGTSNRADEIITYTVNLSGTCGPSCGSVLPIELVSFFGELFSDKVNLGWIVASEKNVDYYLVEKSSDGIGYSLLDKIPAKNSLQKQIYYLTDYDPVPGVNYYRLNNHDKDGQSGNYTTIALEYQNETKKVWVDQDSENLYIHFSSSLKKEKLAIYDITGKMIFEHSLADLSSNTLIVSKKEVKGVYILRNAGAPSLNLKLISY